MTYNRIKKGVFRARPNRFVAVVEVDGEEVVCHVKNTGRCKELLVPGCTVVLAQGDNPARKTPYDVIAVYKGERLINMDSQAPNAVAAEYLRQRFPHAAIRREVRETAQACLKYGCAWDYTLKDISTASYKIGKLTRWNEVVQETLDEYYK